MIVRLHILGHADLGDDGGYTLAELSVALAVTAVATSIALFLVVAITASVERGQREAEAARSAHAAWRHLSDEVRRADRVEPTGPGWTAAFADSTVTYAELDDELLRNDLPLLTSPRLKLTAAVAPVTAGDSLLAHRVDVSVRPAGGQRAASAGEVRLSALVRARPEPSWPEANLHRERP